MLDIFTFKSSNPVYAAQFINFGYFINWNGAILYRCSSWCQLSMMMGTSDLLGFQSKSKKQVTWPLDGKYTYPGIKLVSQEVSGKIRKFCNSVYESKRSLLITKIKLNLCNAKWLCFFTVFALITHNFRTNYTFIILPTTTIRAEKVTWIWTLTVYLNSKAFSMQRFPLLGNIFFYLF